MPARIERTPQNLYQPRCEDHNWSGVPTHHRELAQTNVNVHNTDVDHTPASLFEMEPPC